MKIPPTYTYKNSAAEEPVTAILTDYNLIIQTGEQERKIPYANIMAVRLIRSRKRFAIIIQPDGQAQFIISNLFVVSNRAWEERSDQYAAFVRLLHLHLKEKSVTEYMCGKQLHKLIAWACALVVVSFAATFVLDYLQLISVNAIGLAVFISCGVLLTLVIANWGRFPNIYNPDRIPFRFLPQ